jgi:hypothetical protein
MAAASRPKQSLADLRSVGPRTIEDLHLLGIYGVAALAQAEAGELYLRLCALTGVRHDPCAEDVFAAAIAQARDPDLPREQADWWYWSRVRKARASI